jgi:hypothetical protein
VSALLSLAAAAAASPSAGSREQIAAETHYANVIAERRVEIPLRDG